MDQRAPSLGGRRGRQFNPAAAPHAQMDHQLHLYAQIHQQRHGQPAFRYAQIHHQQQPELAAHRETGRSVKHHLLRQAKTAHRDFEQRRAQHGLVGANGETVRLGGHQRGLPLQ